MTAPISGNFALLDGIVLPLDRDLIDVTGVHWRWTGRRDTDGQPLMQSLGEPNYPGDPCRPIAGVPVPLADVYRHHGPLIPAPHRPTLGEMRAAITRQPTPADVFGGVA